MVLEPVTARPVALSDKEEFMTDQNKAPEPEKSEMRIMWIVTAVIVLLLVGGMGINMLVHRDSGTNATEFSSQSRPVAPK